MELITKARSDFNEWAVAYIRNRHHIFLNRWPFGPKHFPTGFEPCASMVDESFDLFGEALQTRKSYEENLEAVYNRQRS